MSNNQDNNDPQDFDWTNWQRIDEESNHDGPAIYEVRIITGEGTPVPIPRFLSCDNDGLLLIGQTGRGMEARRAQFVCGVENCYGHSEGNLLHQLIRYSPLNERFQDYRLEFRYYPAMDQTAAKLAEEQSIKRYICKFGEVPPLNSVIPNRYGDWGTDGRS